MPELKNKALRSSVRKRERFLLSSLASHRLDEMLGQIGVSRAELSRRLRTSRAHVTQLLSGQRNLTLHTLADVASACRYRVSLSLRPALDLWVTDGDPSITELKSVRRQVVQTISEPAHDDEPNEASTSLQLGVAP